MSDTVEIKPASEEELREALMDVVDPELGIDVVNLGLIYGIHVDDANIATVDMTLTSAACPLTDVIEDQAKSATDGLVSELRINWVWMPRSGGIPVGCRRFVLSGASCRQALRAVSSARPPAGTPNPPCTASCSGTDPA
jgi:metal-sulfur cluster biosynthetic enzyme